MSSRTLTAFIIIALFIGLVGLVVLSQSGKSTSGNKQASKQSSQASPSPASRPAPVAISQFRGTVAATTPTSITVYAKDGNRETFTLGPTVDVQRLVAGTLEKGNAQTKKASISDLKAGGEVLVVKNKASGEVRAVLIIK